MMISMAFSYICLTVLALILTGLVYMVYGMFMIVAEAYSEVRREEEEK